MSKLAILNDTHFGIKNGSDIFIQYADKFFSETFFPYCVENGIKHILHLGDYFDRRKYINFATMKANMKHFIEPMTEKGFTMDLILGNHDTYYKNTNDLNSLKELLGHFMNEIHIIMEPRVMEYGSLKMALLPWITTENYDASIKFVKECN